MFLQSISRKAAGLPLSPLEIHTLVHAGCALFMYGLWFRKPLDVRAPTLVSTAGFEDLLALMLMQSRLVGRTTYSHLDWPKYYERIRYGGSRSEAIYLMFDDTPQPEPLNVLDDAQCACKKITATRASDDAHEETVPNPEGHCTVYIESSDPKDQYADKAEPCESTSGAARRAAGFHCRPPSTMRTVYLIFSFLCCYNYLEDYREERASREKGGYPSFSSCIILWLREILADVLPTVAKTECFSSDSADLDAVGYPSIL